MDSGYPWLISHFNGNASSILLLSMKLAFSSNILLWKISNIRKVERIVYSKHSHTQHLVATINILLHVLLHIYPSTIRFIHPSFYLIFLDAFQSELKTSVQFTSKNFSMHLINQSSMFEMVPFF